MCSFKNYVLFQELARCLSHASVGVFVAECTDGAELVGADVHRFPYTEIPYTQMRDVSMLDASLLTSVVLVGH